MTVYVALLRGINVSGHNIIKMADLRAMFESMGISPVQTYIQSGNVLFRSDDGPDELSVRITARIAETFGLQVPVVLRTKEELERVLRDCPYPTDGLAPGESVYVALLADVPALEAAERLLAYRDETDELRLSGREVYILYRRSAHQSKLTNAWIEKRLGVAATTRNWQTTSKLAAMALALEP